MYQFIGGCNRRNTSLSYLIRRISAREACPRFLGAPIEEDPGHGHDHQRGKSIDPTIHKHTVGDTQQTWTRSRMNESDAVGRLVTRLSHRFSVKENLRKRPVPYVEWGSFLLRIERGCWYRPRGKVMSPRPSRQSRGTTRGRQARKHFPLISRSQFHSCDLLSYWCRGLVINRLRTFFSCGK